MVWATSLNDFLKTRTCLLKNIIFEAKKRIKRSVLC